MSGCGGTRCSPTCRLRRTLEAAERAAEVQERVRAEVRTLAVRDRLRAAVGTRVRLRLADGGLLAGTLARVGPDWLLLDADAGREVIVPLSALLSVSGLGRQAAAPGAREAVDGRLGLWFVLRHIARDRSPLAIGLRDGTTLHGTIDRVGADFVDVAVTAPGELRRADGVREVLLVPMAALVAVSRLTG